MLIFIFMQLITFYTIVCICSDDGTPWIPTALTVICGDHFVGNKPLRHPNSPAYVPTIFPTTYKKKKNNELQQSSRYKRFCHRSSNVGQSTVPVIEANSNPIDSGFKSFNINKSLTNCDVGTQVSFDVTDVKHFSFECCFLNNNCISTSITTPTNFIIKQQQNVKDKCCGPSSESYNSCLSCDKFHGYESINSELSLKDLTGTTYAVFNMLVNMLPGTGVNSTLNNYNKLLLFLMKIKLGVSFSAIGVMFKIHRTTVSRIFFNILSILSKKTKQFIFWPSKDTISATLPYAFKKNYPNCRCIIDCTEIKVEQPPTVEQRVCMYSRYKSSYTIKCLVAITPNGAISFLSKCYGGRSSDTFITNDSGFLSKLEVGDQVLADKGFPGIKTNCEEGNSILIMPPILHNGRFSEEEVIETYSVASVRIHIERFFARLKTYHILNKIQIELLPHIDDIMHICCTLTNLQIPIIKQ